MSDLFAVDKETFANACDISMNAAIAYLVLACGTGGDNSTTKWSVHAIESRTSISRGRARKAIDQLLNAELISKKNKSTTHPQYKLPVKRAKGRVRDAIWLPNSIVEGAAGETPAIERIRQTHDAMTLRLFVELYDAQNLAEHGGIDPGITWFASSAHKITKRLRYDIWGFNWDCQTMRWSSPVAEVHMRRELTEEEVAKGVNKGVDFFKRFERLLNLGLVVWVPCLLDGSDEDAEIIHPIGGDTYIEQELGKYATRAAWSLIPEEVEKRAGEYSHIALVPRHIESPSVIAIARLLHRPNTKLTQGWWAKSNRQAHEFVTEYKSICGEIENVQYQG